MRKIISLLMIALSIFFAIPHAFAMNPPNPAPSGGPPDDEKPDKCKDHPELPECQGGDPCDTDPTQCPQTCEQNPCQSQCKTPCKCDDDPTNSKKNSNSCSIDMSIPFGRILHRDSYSALLTVHRDKPSSSLFSPQSLDYSLFEAEAIVAVATEDLDDGISREITIKRSNGEYIYYKFQTGESIGYPSGDTIRFSSKLIMLDANGNQVTDDPVFYDRVFSDTTVIRYLAASKTIVYVINPNGTKINLSNPDSGMDIIRDEWNSYRQIWSLADGLCDIVVIDEYKYEIRLYTPENAGSKNTSTGLYVPTGTPRSVWTIENPLRSDTNFDNVRITEQANGTSYVYNWQYNESLDQWTVTAGAGARVSSMSKLWNTARTTMNFVQDIKDSSGNLAYRRYGVTVKKTWGDVTTEEHIGNDSSPLSSTYYTYYEDSSETGKYGKLKSTIENSHWILCDYDSEGRKTYVSESWLDAASGASAAQVKTYYYSYTPVDPEDILEFNDQRYRTVDIRIQNITVQKIYYAYKTNANGEKVTITEDAASPSAAYGAAGNKRTVITFYGDAAGERLAGRLKTKVKPDGLIETYTYEYGTYAPNADPTLSTFTAGTGYAMRTTVTHGTEASPDGIAGKTLREITVFDEFGNDALEEKYVYTGSGYERIAWILKTFDSEHHVTASYSSNNTSTTANWNCCSKASETTSEGIEYVYTYDLLKRMATKTKKGHNGSADIVSTYSYDSRENVLSDTVSAGSLSLSTSKTYDLMSRILSETDASGLTTTYAYSSDGKTITKILPGGFTVITVKYADGQVKSVTGTAVVVRYFEHGVNSDGTRWTKIYTGSSGSARWTKTTTDMLNRTVKEEQPGYNGSTIITQYFYNDKSQLIKVSKTGSADTLYAYDEVGNQIRTCLDVNANGSIDLASMDRITEQETTIVSEDNAWWQKFVSKVYAIDNDSTATTTETTKSQLTGLPTGIVLNQVSTDIYGNITISTTMLDRENKTVTQTTDVPDSTVDAQTIAVNGLTISSRSTSNLTTTYSYDDLGRQVGVTDPRIGTSMTHYNALNQVDYVEDAAGNRTSYAYETTTGRLLSITNAMNKSKIYTYNERGQTLSARGDTEYPVDFVYDSYGQTIQLKTYRTDLNIPDITTWTYEPATGLLLSKIYADNKGTTYTYTTDGKPVTRIWARGVTTTYGYDSNTGELLAVDYSDNTPDITITYNRKGQQKAVTDAVGTRTFSYNSALQLTNEIISGIYSKELVRSYDSMGRYSGMNIGTEYDVDYGYDTYGRFATLTNGSDVYTYNYLANSKLLASINYPHDITTANSYESNRDLITTVENKYDTTTISKYDYVNDALGRRTSMSKSGSAFSQNGSITYGYNDRSEVTSAVASNDTSYNYGYNFDYIGNRITSTLAGTTTNYTSSNLNQYTVAGSLSPTYDDDGDMLTNGTWTYTWNAENRMISATNGTRTLEFKYDYMGRRVEKKVTDSGTTSKHERFIYDSFKQIEELDGANSNATLKKFVWNGEAPFSVYDVTADATCYYALDANKNIGQLINASGTIVANYEYSPFGKLTVCNDSIDNPFGFSSEYYDSETALIYYNYRYYTPTLGRWTKHDDIEENGGWNLYCILRNNFIDQTDYLGRLTKYDSVTDATAEAKELATKATKDHPENYEYCGLICKQCINGVLLYYKTGPIVGHKKGSCIPGYAPCNKDSVIVAAYHSHPPDAPLGKFSKADTDWAEKQKKPIILFPTSKGDDNKTFIYHPSYKSN